MAMTGISNFYFNNYNASGEQNLLENLIIESISIYGQDMWYIPRQIKNYDQLLTQDDQSTYNQAYQICTYIKSVDGFTGDGEFISKFGIEIRDQATFSIPMRTFNDVVGAYTGQTRPNEGDLIYFPLNDKCFQIKYTDKFAMYYQLGGLQLWNVTVELFEYSNEILNTGIPSIDFLQKNFSTDILDYALLDENGAMLMDELGNYLVSELYDIETIDVGSENNTLFGGSNNFNTGANSFVVFTESNPFSDDPFPL